MSKIKIGGIMQTPRLSALRILGVEDRPGIAAAVLDVLGKERINVQFIVQCIDWRNRTHITLCIDRDDLSMARELVEPAARAMGAESVEQTEQVSLISIFGPDFRERPGIAGDMFTAMADKNINIFAISTSISTVSCVIAAGDLELAVQSLQEKFELP